MKVTFTASGHVGDRRFRAGDEWDDVSAEDALALAKAGVIEGSDEIVKASAPKKKGGK